MKGTISDMMSFMYKLGIAELNNAMKQSTEYKAEATGFPIVSGITLIPTGNVKLRVEITWIIWK